jgi:ABC-type multidrug transport system ATPase subunit
MEISVRDLRKTYDSFLLSVPKAAFPSGSITALIGPNGKGKTTFLRILAGLDDNFTGTITYDGKPLNRRIRRSMTMTFQTPMLLNRSVYANVEYPLKIRGAARGARKERVDELLEKLSINHLSKKNAVKLSGGESQKAALARGLSLEPRILLLDEPFSAIDQQSIDDMMDCIADYNAASGATVILVTHDSAQIERLSSHVVEI